MDDMLARIVEQVGSLTDQVVSLQAQVAQLKDEVRFVRGSESAAVARPGEQ